MASFQGNPFGDPNAAPPPPPAGSGNNYGTVEDYNPFADDNKPNEAASQPAPPPPTSTSAAPLNGQPSAASDPAASAELQRRQEELERKAAELERREQEMAQMAQGMKVNNFPPLPSWFPLQPCFYQDISVEINPIYQGTVRLGLILWIVWSCSLFLNMISLLIVLCSPPDGIAPLEAATSFGLSILWVILFIPLSLIGWQRSLYKAFRSDSSINFMVFFLSMFFQIVVSGVAATGFSQSGWSGFVIGMGCAKKAGIQAIVLIVAVVFLGQFCIQIFILIRTHRFYRQTDASISKAQSELASGALANPTVQRGVAQGVSTAVRNQYGS